MGKKDKRVDAFIASKPEWAQEIITRLRDIAHEAIPDVEETIKWGMPAFMSNGIVCVVGAFKAKCDVNFWKKKLVGPMEPLNEITSVKDLPSKKVLSGYFKKVAALNASGETVPKAPPGAKKALPMPTEFMSAIRKNKKAHAVYEKFSPSHQREYIAWITEAKGEDTRARRIAQAVEWMAEGKPRNWKYM